MPSEKDLTESIGKLKGNKAASLFWPTYPLKCSKYLNETQCMFWFLRKIKCLNA